METTIQIQSPSNFLSALGAGPASVAAAAAANIPLSSSQQVHLRQNKLAAQAQPLDSATDQKILEIILEISFLIVCLLAYQVCSKACCPEEKDDDLLDEKISSSSNNHNHNNLFGHYGHDKE